MRLPEASQGWFFKVKIAGNIQDVSKEGLEGVYSFKPEIGY